MVKLLKVLFFFVVSVSSAHVYDIVIIGGGPAGWSAAMEAARARVSVLVVAGNNDGGQLTASHMVENIPAVKAKPGFEIMNDLRDQALSCGAQLLTDTVVGVDFDARPFRITTSGNDMVQARSVIIATGSTPKKLGVPGEERFWGYGVSSCAVCDCFLYSNRSVVVVGGGDSAIEEALQLVEYASNITILVRSQVMRASNWMQEKLKKHVHKITILYDVTVQEICGTNEQGVIGVRIREGADNKESVVSTDGVFLAIGHVPNSSLFTKWLSVDEKGYLILHSRSQATVLPGVFVAGDVADPHFKKAYIAMSSGGQAALEAVHFVRYQG